MVKFSNNSYSREIDLSQMQKHVVELREYAMQECKRIGIVNKRLGGFATVLTFGPFCMVNWFIVAEHISGMNMKQY